jgi:hypothetical protein
MIGLNKIKCAEVVEKKNVWIGMNEIELCISYLPEGI